MRSQLPLRVSTTLLVLAATVSPSVAEWTQFGGPGRNFVTAAVEIPAEWSGPMMLWERDLGPGYSGIVTDGERLITMTRRGDMEVVVALEPDTGKTLWEYTYPATHPDGAVVDTTWGSGPNGTPLIAAGRVYTLGFWGALHCLDAATGMPLWTHDLGGEFGVEIPNFGLSTSPIRYQDLLIVIAGGALAFSLDTGEPVWANRQFEGSYSSPALLERNGWTQLIAPVAGEVVALEPASGRLVWRHQHANDYSTFLSGPVLGEDDLLFASAYFIGSVVLRLAPDGSSVTEVWKDPNFQLSQTNSVRVGGVIYGFHNSILRAVHIASGETLWRSRGFERANLIRIGDRFLFFDRHGLLSLVSLDAEGVILHASAPILEGRCWTAPTVDGHHLYARNLERIVAVDLSRSGDRPPPPVQTAERRSPVAAPEGFLAAKERLMDSYLHSDREGLAEARRDFERWTVDPSLAALASYYIGFAAYNESLLSDEGAGLGLLREAEDRLVEATRLDETFAEAHAFLARIYPLYWRFDPARAAVVGPLGDEHMETALGLEPDNPRVLAFRGLDLFYSPPEYGGDLEMGVVSLRRAIEILAEEPERPMAAEPDWGRATFWVWYGRMLERRVAGDRDRAVDSYRKALASAPAFAQAKRLLEGLVGD